jgi:hypothetical protein
MCANGVELGAAEDEFNKKSALASTLAYSSGLIAEIAGPSDPVS